MRSINRNLQNLPATFLYDPAGNLSSLSSPSELGDTFWFYDAFGQLLTTMTPGDYFNDNAGTGQGIPVGFGGQWGYYTDANAPVLSAAGHICLFSRLLIL